MSTKSKKCPLCEATKTIKKGTTGNGRQLYGCKDCGHRFTYSKREKRIKTKQILIDFVFHKQVIRELKNTYDINEKTIALYINNYKVKEKKHNPRAVNLVADALYFGTREDDATWCIIVFRDPKEKENIWWCYEDAETESAYRRGKLYLESLGYIILSITGDGFSGLRYAFLGIPYQMCLVHMERIVIRGTTRKPKLIQGQALLALIKTIFDTDEQLFKKRFNKYMEMYRGFLNEKAYSETTGEWWYVHDDLRSASMSLERFILYLFTFKKDRSIPSTTNSIEGHFSHIRDVVNIHRGSSKELKQKIIHIILLASTIAPDDENLGDVI